MRSVSISHLRPPRMSGDTMSHETMTIVFAVLIGLGVSLGLKSIRLREFGFAFAAGAFTIAVAHFTGFVP